MISYYRNKGQRTQNRYSGYRLIILLLIVSIPAYSQTIVQLKKGLIVTDAHQYGREAMFKDRLAFEIYNTTLATPAAGQTAFTNEKGEAKKWVEIEANKEFKFKDTLLSNGYLYLTYVSDSEKTALVNITGHSMFYLNGVPRSGDIYNSGWLDLPVTLKKGVNEFYIRSSRFSVEEGISAKITFPAKPILINKEDPTLPYIVLGRGDGHQFNRENINRFKNQIIH
jgi:hypothetical protein